MTTYKLNMIVAGPDGIGSLPWVDGFSSVDAAIGHVRENHLPRGVRATVVEFDDDGAPVRWFGRRCDGVPPCAHCYPEVGS